MIISDCLNYYCLYSWTTQRMYKPSLFFSSEVCSFPPLPKANVTLMWRDSSYSLGISVYLAGCLFEKKHSFFCANLARIVWNYSCKNIFGIMLQKFFKNDSGTIFRRLKKKDLNEESAIMYGQTHQETRGCRQTLVLVLTERCVFRANFFLYTIKYGVAI